MLTVMVGVGVRGGRGTDRDRALAVVEQRFEGLPKGFGVVSMMGGRRGMTLSNASPR